MNPRGYGPWTLGVRERERLVWRANVNAAARAFQAACRALQFQWRGRTQKAVRWSDRETFDAALAAPKPWRSPRRTR